MFANDRVTTSRPGEKPRAAIYSRPSASDKSREDREPELVTYCRGREWEPRPFRDDRSSLSGSRPGLELLLDAVRSRKVEVVVCAKLTDLAGSLAQFAVLYEEFKTHQVGLVCIDQGSTPFRRQEGPRIPLLACSTAS
jgi:DNA invertase Pin-like site-specific DNA recombinase